MTEILTESFCERCGTRYTFQTAAPHKSRIKRLKVMSRGLKNYVLSDETTLEDAFADARSDEERSISTEQLDAFHQTFNFCFSCRQYTCANCWNQPENLCLTCAPDLSHEILPAPFPALALPPTAAEVGIVAADAASHDEGRAAFMAALAWPDADLPLREAGAEDEATAAAVVAPEGEPAPEGAAVAPVVVEPEVAPAVEAFDSEPAVALVSKVAAAETVEGGPEPEFAVALGPEGIAAEAQHPPVIEAAAVEVGVDVAQATPETEAVEAKAEHPPVVEAAAIAAVASAGEPVSHDDHVVIAAAQTAALLTRFRPDRDLDGELEVSETTAPAIEPQAEATADAESEAPAPIDAPAAVRAELEAPSLIAAVAAAPLVEPDAELAVPEPGEPEPVASEPAAAVATPQPEPQAQAEPPVGPPVPVERRDDRVEIPTWRITAPDTTAAGLPVAPPVVTPSTTPSTPVWPTQASPDAPAASGPQWPSAAFVPSVPAARARDAMWAASGLELVEKAGGGVQACVSCGLALSATARFCRRCGGRQG